MVRALSLMGTSERQASRRGAGSAVRNPYRDRARAARLGRMKSYGQFCSVARALDLLGERWTLLIVREFLCGSRSFGDVRRGIPRISRTMLAQRLHELCDAQVIVRYEDASGPAYRLSATGRELDSVVRALGVW